MNFKIQTVTLFDLQDIHLNLLTLAGMKDESEENKLRFIVILNAVSTKLF